MVNRLVRDYGLMHLSMGKAIRKLMETHSHTELVKAIVTHLKKGAKVPDELAVQALDTCRLDPQCQIQGLVKRYNLLSVGINFSYLICYYVVLCVIAWTKLFRISACTNIQRLALFS